MPQPQYRDRASRAEVGDFVRGWQDAGATEEVAGVVVSVHPDATYGSNVTLAVLDLDEQPEGAEVAPEDLAPGEVSYKNHAGRTCVLATRTIEAHADRLELVHRRANREGYQGVLRRADPASLEARQRAIESRRRQMEATSFVPPRAAETVPPVVSTPPAPLPKTDEPAAPPPPGANPPPKDAPKKDEPKKKG